MIEHRKEMLLYKSAWPNGLDGLADQPCCCNVHTRERAAGLGTTGVHQEQVLGAGDRAENGRQLVCETERTGHQ